MRDIKLHLYEEPTGRVRFRQSFVIRENEAGDLEIVRAGSPIVDSDRSLTIPEIKVPITMEVERG